MSEAFLCSLKSRFIYGSQAHSPDYMIQGSNQYFFFKDHLGSILSVVNIGAGTTSQSLRYNDRGQVLSDTNPGFQPFGYAGGHYDYQTGLVRFGARDYDAITGRWTAKDPILFGGGTSNLYEYSKNDPVNYIDSSGRDPIALFAAEAFGVAIDFLSNYFKMREKKVPGGDKYYHCMANCQASKRGIIGKWLAKIISETREQTDERFKNRPKNDCDADRVANKTGQDSPPDQDCEATCSGYRPAGL